MLRPAIFRHWRWIVALTAVALCSGLAFHLIGTLAPWAEPDGLALTAPAPTATAPTAPTSAHAAVRKAVSELTSRANFAPAHPQDLAAVTAFYNAHSRRLLWVTESGISARGNSVINEIGKADDWGLRARDFALPHLPPGASPETVAAAEIAVTLAVLKYARYARGGRFSDPSSISKLLDHKPPVRRAGDVLRDTAASAAPDAYLRSLHPQHEQFEALRRLLLKLRGPDPTALVEPGRESADRSLTLARILVNMERWRWLPADLGAFYVWNNVPEFVTRVVRRGETIHSDKIVAGQPDWATPAFSADLKTIVFHPGWVVPDGIKRKELLPRLRDSSQSGLVRLFTGAKSSRAMLEQHGLQVYYQGRPIDPDQVDWSKGDIGAFDFRQPPGPTNPLGSIKFMFPNRHDVYMHDTPERGLFARSFRGLSHGCMRVAAPLRLAAILLAQDKGWSEQQVESLLSGGTSEVQLTTRIPVHMTYFTAMVDRQGELQTFGDLYGLDTRMGEVLFGAKVPFVTPRYDDEIAAMRARDGPATASSGPATLADAIASIFSP
ncbi:MAG TPA: L,D-transpeptidase family protein [Hyphomicrobiaceae bacterium]|jgi:murein L,D-transpeptidase YcbB/YkuD|nr:L,D-transpeptidase family protein [Hyphomicrobiaceae bacterium]